MFFLIHLCALIGCVLLLIHEHRRAQRGERAYRRVLEFCDGDETQAKISFYHPWRDLQGRRPVDCTDDAGYRDLDRLCTQLEHGVLP